MVCINEVWLNCHADLSSIVAVTLSDRIVYIQFTGSDIHHVFFNDEVAKKEYVIILDKWKAYQEYNVGVSTTCNR